MPYYVRTILITGSGDDVAPARRDHLSHVAQLKAAGRVRAAGAFLRGDGFLEIFEAKDLYEAEEIARSSPLVALGLGSWIVREWEELSI